MFGWQRQEVCCKSEARLVFIKVQAVKSSTTSPCPKQTMKRKETKNSGNNELFVYCLLYGVPWKVLGVLQYSPCFHLGLGKSHDLNISDEKCMQLNVMEISDG